MASAEPPLLWEAYNSDESGGWQLDHIVSLKSPITLEDGSRRDPNFAEIVARCNHSNIRPLDRVEHLTKSLAETLDIRGVRDAARLI